MKSKIRSCVILLLIALVLSFTACTEQSEPEPFSCFTVDQQGNQLLGHQREADGVWYLFVPSYQSISDLVVYYEGTVKSASSGVLKKNHGMLTNAFENNGDKVELKVSEEETITVAVMQSELPAVHIRLNETDLETVHQDKNEKYPENTVIITDRNGIVNVIAENTVELKGRGNSTWNLYDKKPYQIKFDDKTSVLGMGAAKKWVLLANASDDSMIRTKLVYDMAQKMDMGFVPSFEYVDLWIDGEYLGTYMIGEKVELGSSRLDLENDAGGLFEYDELFYAEEDYWFFNTMFNGHFTLKEIVEEEDTIVSAAMSDFNHTIDALAALFYYTPSSELTLDKLSEIIDVDSFIKYYLVNEYVLNRESFTATSFYWYKDGEDDVLHLGPIWDFDSCMGNDGVSYTESYGDVNFIFSYLLASPEFKARTEQLYLEYQDELYSMTEAVPVLKTQIEDSAAMNYLRWDVLGKPTGKDVLIDFLPTFDEAVQAVEIWLTGREEHFTIPDCAVSTSYVSDDCSTMEVLFADGKTHESVLFAVWNPEHDSENIAWCTATEENGVWRCTVDLSRFNSAGLYRMDVYVDNEMSAAVASGRSYVANTVKSKYTINTEMTADDHLRITLDDSGSCANIVFAVWSDANAQDDIQWYTATKNDIGLWTYTVDLKDHGSTGRYHIHAYMQEGEHTTFIHDAVVTVESIA